MAEWVVETRAPGAEVEQLAYITEVPAAVKRADVEDAVQLYHRWPQWTARFTIGTVVKVRRIRAESTPVTSVVLGWEDLAPDSKRISIELGGALHAQLAREARANNRPISQCVIEAVSQWLGEP